MKHQEWLDEVVQSIYPAYSQCNRLHNPNKVDIHMPTAFGENMKIIKLSQYIFTFPFFEVVRDDFAKWTQEKIEFQVKQNA